MQRSQPIIVSGVCYFASDFHFGAPDWKESDKREQLVIKWLDSILPEVNHLFLLGDVFDFWFEYNGSPPPFYALFLKKLEEMTTKGIKIYFFTGNHDMWAKNYLKDHVGIHIFHHNQEFIMNNKKFLLGHRDGLGKGEFGYRCLKGFLNCKLNRWLFGLIPPKTGFHIAHFFSNLSRNSEPQPNKDLIENQKKLIVQFYHTNTKTQDVDYYIFGDIHFPLEMVIDNAIYFNTGDWLIHNSFIRYEKIPALYFFQ
jgi:UDP-2,3-diacylglucosamine hydrolase